MAKSRPEIPVQSFDIFDTVLVRTWAKPTDLFWELGVQLQQAGLIQIAPEQWQHLRIEAEREARKTVASGEISLPQIYQQLGPLLKWGVSDVETAMQSEIQLERASLRPILSNQTRIQQLHAQHHPVAFLSDMYLPGEVIQGFLKEHQLLADGDQLYVSGDIGINKGSGQMFQHYLRQHQIQPTQLHHTGDNLYSDIQVPQNLGIQATPFLQAHLNRYERLVADDTQLPLRVRSLLAGASRLCRLSCPETDLHRQTIWQTAANVIAPVLVGFVHWTLQEATRQGIQRLYFVARDGQILWKIAQILCRKWGYSIDCRYFYGSRQAFHFPAIQSIGEDELTWLLAKLRFTSIRVVCDRVNLQPEQIAPILLRHGFPPDTWDQNLTEQDVTTLRGVFQDPDVVKQITDLAADYRAAAIGYFQQAGIADGTPFALVDTGWSGQSQRSFSKLLNSAGLYPETGVTQFYFGLDKVVTPFGCDRLIPYFLEANAATDRYFLCGKELLELFLTADHGSTVRYAQQNQTYAPILRSQTNETAIDWGVLVQQQSILQFTELLTDTLRPQECDVQCFHKITETLLKTFIFTPSQAEAEAFGTQSFSQHQSESQFYDFAPRYSLLDGLKMFLNQYYVHDFVWLSASMQRSSGPTKIPLRWIQRIRNSDIYCMLGWRALEAGNKPQARQFALKSAQSNPFNLTHISLIRLILRATISPTLYSQVRQVFRQALGTKPELLEP